MIFFSHFFRNLTNQIVILVWANQQGSGKCLKPIFCGISGRCFHTDAVAGGATVRKIRIDTADKRPKPVFIADHQLEMNAFGVGHQCIFAAFVFRERVNVGVVPKADRFDALAAQRFNAHDGAGGTAGV